MKPVIAIQRGDGSLVAMWSNVVACAEDLNVSTTVIHNHLNRPWYDPLYLIALKGANCLDEYSVFDKEISDTHRKLSNSDVNVVVLMNEEYLDIKLAKPILTPNINLDHLADEEVVQEPIPAPETDLKEEKVVTGNEVSIKELLARKSVLNAELLLVNKRIEDQKESWVEIGRLAGWIND